MVLEEKIYPQKTSITIDMIRFIEILLVAVFYYICSSFLLHFIIFGNLDSFYVVI